MAMSHCTGTDALSKVKAGSYRCHVGGGRADRGGAFVRSLVMVRREPPTGGSCLFARRPCNPHHRCEPTRLNLVAPYVRSAQCARLVRARHAGWQCLSNDVFRSCRHQGSSFVSCSWEATTLLLDGSTEKVRTVSLLVS